jgi:hypothetical protein
VIPPRPKMERSFEQIGEGARFNQLRTSDVHKPLSHRTFVQELGRHQR